MTAAIAKTAENTPWTVRRDDSGGEIGLWSVIDTKGTVVFFGMEEGEARLFADSPDMQATIDALVAVLREAREAIPRDDYFKVVPKINAALKLARGAR